MHRLSMTAHFPRMKTTLQSPVVSRYRTWLIKPLKLPAEAATDRRDFGAGVERAGDRSIYPRYGSGASFAVVGGRRGDCGFTEIPELHDEVQRGKGVNTFLFSYRLSRFSRFSHAA